MAQQHYHFEADGGFVIEQYHDCPPFASFLPGIAGVSGRPAWVFYVNRGQAIASFGVRNKDGAFLEFFPADKAYQLTASRGFRTFLKISDADGEVCYEPFQRGQGGEVRQQMRVTAHEVGIEEFNPPLELTIRADLFTLPETSVAGLVRRVEICNTAPIARRFEIVDGLPQVQPYAMNQWLLKFMSRTSEAFMQVEDVAENRPFYRLKVWPTDSPQVERVEAGNFFIGLCDGKLNPVIADAERVFGLAGDFSSAEAFYNGALQFDRQISANQTPAAFQALSTVLQPGESRVFYGIYGHAASKAIYHDFIAAALHDGFCEDKRDDNRRLIDAIRRRAFTATALPLFDAHVQQCYLDNGLRGGFPQTVPGGGLLYLFGRKHGDLERDYNDFLLQDTPYSEGNGDFRDVLQNRRVDLWFQPALADKNIRYFFNLIQPDGYNPCALRNSRFVIDDAGPFGALGARYPGLLDLLSKPFKYAELWQLLAPAGDGETLIGDLLATAREVEDAEFDRGYWSDHWSYLVDLLLNFQAVYPEQVTALLLSEGYSFFDPTHGVAPRAAKYQVTDRGLRQYDAVQFSAEKKALIEARSGERYRVRGAHGRGDIVYTSLLGKIMTLLTNKLATLDPAGIGIEMEADRPGWCDALNGLPGILGSAINETIELKRLADFTLAALAECDAAVHLPVELAQLVADLDRLLQQPHLPPLQFWRDSGALKESYRQKVFMGFSGELRHLQITALRDFMARASHHLDQAISRAKHDQGITTYFAYAGSDYVVNDAGQPEITNAKAVALPLFLEGYVHALRIADADEARRLYRAVRDSALFDPALGMYRLNAPLGEQALDLGRIGVFNYGWLENGSIFLHMHYKFALEMVRAGLIDEFYAAMPQLLVCFHAAERYQRNPLENSSFLVCSGFSVDSRQHGRGCVARLSGSTVELLHLTTLLFLGEQPFRCEDGELRFQPAPLLAASLFTAEASCISLGDQQLTLASDSAAFTLFGRTLLVYHNPGRHNSYGTDGVKPSRYHLRQLTGEALTVEARFVSGELAADLRRGRFCRVDIELA